MQRFSFDEKRLVLCAFFLLYLTMVNVWCDYACHDVVVNIHTCVDHPGEVNAAMHNGLA